MKLAPHKIVEIEHCFEQVARMNEKAVIEAYSFDEAMGDNLRKMTAIVENFHMDILKDLRKD